MDFVRIDGNTPEQLDENCFLYNVNASAKIERLREFVGLDNANFMRVAGQAAEFVTAASSSGKKADAKAVCKWLQLRIRWGSFHCPDPQTVERLLTNWAAIKQKSESHRARRGCRVTLWPKQLDGLADEAGGRRPKD